MQAVFNEPEPAVMKKCGRDYSECSVALIQSPKFMRSTKTSRNKSMISQSITKNKNITSNKKNRNTVTKTRKNIDSETDAGWSCSLPKEEPVPTSYICSPVASHESISLQPLTGAATSRNKSKISKSITKNKNKQKDVTQTAEGDILWDVENIESDKMFPWPLAIPAPKTSNKKNQNTVTKTRKYNNDPENIDSEIDAGGSCSLPKEEPVPTSYICSPVASHESISLQPLTGAATSRNKSKISKSITKNKNKQKDVTQTAEGDILWDVENIESDKMFPWPLAIPAPKTSNKKNQNTVTKTRKYNNDPENIDSEIDAGGSCSLPKEEPVPTSYICSPVASHESISLQPLTGAATSRNKSKISKSITKNKNKQKDVTQTAEGDILWDVENIESDKMFPWPLAIPAPKTSNKKNQNTVTKTRKYNNDPENIDSEIDAGGSCSLPKEEPVPTSYICSPVASHESISLQPLTGAATSRNKSKISKSITKNKNKQKDVTQTAEGDILWDVENIESDKMFPWPLAIPAPKTSNKKNQNTVTKTRKYNNDPENIDSEIDAGGSCSLPKEEPVPTSYICSPVASHESISLQPLTGAATSRNKSKISKSITKNKNKQKDVTQTAEGDILWDVENIESDKMFPWPLAIPAPKTSNKKNQNTVTKTRKYNNDPENIDSEIDAGGSCSLPKEEPVPTSYICSPVASHESISLQPLTGAATSRNKSKISKSITKNKNKQKDVTQTAEGDILWDVENIESDKMFPWPLAIPAPKTSNKKNQNTVTKTRKYNNDPENIDSEIDAGGSCSLPKEEPVPTSYICSPVASHESISLQPLTGAATSRNKSKISKSITKNKNKQKDVTQTAEGDILWDVENIESDKMFPWPLAIPAPKTSNKKNQNTVTKTRKYNNDPENIDSEIDAGGSCSLPKEEPVPTSYICSPVASHESISLQPLTGAATSRNKSKISKSITKNKNKQKDVTQTAEGDILWDVENIESDKMFPWPLAIPAPKTSNKKNQNTVTKTRKYNNDPENIDSEIDAGGSCSLPKEEPVPTSYICSPVASHESISLQPLTGAATSRNKSKISKSITKNKNKQKDVTQTAEGDILWDVENIESDKMFPWPLAIPAPKTSNKKNQNTVTKTRKYNNDPENIDSEIDAGGSCSLPKEEPVPTSYICSPVASHESISLQPLTGAATSRNKSKISKSITKNKNKQKDVTQTAEGDILWDVENIESDKMFPWPLAIPAPKTSNKKNQNTVTKTRKYNNDPENIDSEIDAGGSCSLPKEEPVPTSYICSPVASHESISLQPLTGAATSRNKSKISKSITKNKNKQKDVTQTAEGDILWDVENIESDKMFPWPLAIPAPKTSNKKNQNTVTKTRKYNNDPENIDSEIDAGGSCSLPKEEPVPTSYICSSLASHENISIQPPTSAGSQISKVSHKKPITFTEHSTQIYRSKRRVVSFDSETTSNRPIHSQRCLVDNTNTTTVTDQQTDTNLNTLATVINNKVVVPIDWCCQQQHSELPVNGMQVNYTMRNLQTEAGTISYGQLKLAPKSQKPTKISKKDITYKVDKGEALVKVQTKQQIGGVGWWFHIPLGAEYTIINLKDEPLILTFVKVSRSRCYL